MLNREGIELLKADLRFNSKMYSQEVFGTHDKRVISPLEDQSDCGTFMCQAGFCLARKIGMDEFNKIIASHNWKISIANASIDAGFEQLGINRENYDSTEELPDIFTSPEEWPDELREAYEKATTSPERAEVACKALDLMDEYGNLEGKRSYDLEYGCGNDDDDDMPF